MAPLCASILRRALNLPIVMGNSSYPISNGQSKEHPPIVAQTKYSHIKLYTYMYIYTVPYFKPKSL